MSDRSTFVSDRYNKLATPRQFTFDHSYWSHSGYTCTKDGFLKPDGDKYVDQKHVFDDLGTGLLESAWSGYNCTLFAYGQTGSGKTYSMMGYEPNQGIIPRLCERLYEDIEKKASQQDGIIYQVSFSMLEIYNEKVYDLLNTDSTTPEVLTVRMTPKHSFIVDGLQSFPVSCYKDIVYYIEECNKNRTVAVTRMNEKSSRAHTIVILTLVQNFIREKRLKTSKINLVDLAGSERANQTGATGVRFEESKNINKSLMTLGIVIKNLCAVACGRMDQGPTPYRDSKLTMLLKDAIGGNCKTIMIATISPSDEDYEQTLSTLRYADRVKSIRNTVIVNVTETSQLIKELLAEKESLLNQLQERRNSQTGYSEQEIAWLKQKQLSEIDQIKNEMSNMEKEWEKKLQHTKMIMEEHAAKEKRLEQEKRKFPHLINLNEDPALSGKICHFVRSDQVSTVGNSKASSTPTIVLHGPSIGKEHAAIHNKGTTVKMVPLQGQVKVNGVTITEPTPLHHHDRIFFSASNLFVFHNPSEETALKTLGRKIPVVTYEVAQTEIGRHSQIQTGLEWLKEDIGEMLVQTYEANSMAMELNRGIRFEPVMVPSLVLGDKHKPSQIYIKAMTTDGGEFLWGKNQFLDRFDLMMSIFQKYENGEADWEPKTKEQDPFWEPLETPTLIGVTFVPLESISYMLDIDEQRIGIYDYQAKHVGHLTISLVPCTADGVEESEDLAVDSPSELIGQSISFKMKIKGASGIPKRFRSSWCHYSFHADQGRVYTDEVYGVVPKYNFEHLHTMNNVTPQMISYLEEDSLMIELYGRQRKSNELRRGSTIDAYTLSDRRRTSTVFTADTRKNSSVLKITDGSSFVPHSLSNEHVKEEDETNDGDDDNDNDDNDADDDDNNDNDADDADVDDGEEKKDDFIHPSRKCTETTSLDSGQPSTQNTSIPSLSDTDTDTNGHVPGILSGSKRKCSLSELSEQMRELRTGISSVMDAIIKRHGITECD